MTLKEKFENYYDQKIFKFFGYSIGDNEFFLLLDNEDAKHTQVTEPEWMELLTKHKEENGN